MLIHVKQVIVLAVCIITMEVYHTEMPVWGVLVAFAMAIVYIIPVGTVYAVANLNANVLTVLGEIISGYLLPGKPIVMLIFKVRLIPNTTPLSRSLTSPPASSTPTPPSARP